MVTVSSPQAEWDPERFVQLVPRSNRKPPRRRGAAQRAPPQTKNLVVSSAVGSHPSRRRGSAACVHRGFHMSGFVFSGSIPFFIIRSLPVRRSFFSVVVRLTTAIGYAFRTALGCGWGVLGRSAACIRLVAAHKATREKARLRASECRAFREGGRSEERDREEEELHHVCCG